MFQALGMDKNFVRSYRQDTSRCGAFLGTANPSARGGIRTLCFRGVLSQCLHVTACLLCLQDASNRLCPRVSVSFFLDDSKLRAKQSEFVELDEACRQFQLFDQLSGQQLNAEKCVGWGTTTEARKHASKLVPPQGQVVLHAMSLGMVIPTSG